VLLLPRPLAHQLIPGPGAAPELVSAAIDFGPNDENPLLRGLPDLLHVPLAQLQADASALVRVLVQQSLVTEAAAQRCGHAAVVDRLVEVGVLAGLADARLSRVLNALHAEPERPWTLDTMARLAGMSRAFLCPLQRRAGHAARRVSGHPAHWSGALVVAPGHVGQAGRARGRLCQCQCACACLHATPRAVADSVVSAGVAGGELSRDCGRTEKAGRQSHGMLAFSVF